MPNADTLLNRIRREGITSERLLDAFKTVNREHFVPASASPEDTFRDAPVPIGHKQTTSQPSLIARMINAMQLGPNAAVLEIGTGHGYQTAVLSVLVARVVSVERFSALAAQAKRNLSEAGFLENVTLLVGDGTNGAPKYAAYDGIVVSAAAPHVPQPYIDQLNDAGRIVIPIGPGGAEEVRVFEKEGTQLVEKHSIGYASFVRLVGEHGHSE
jgi:protein-L-isoaspartate(D-aspartate) O-methyltransferase